MGHTYDAAFYLCLKRREVNEWRAGPLVARLTNKQPALSAGEICVKLDVSLPVALFERPSFQATIAVDPNEVTPTVVDVATTDNIAETLSKQLGIRVNVTATPPPDSDKADASQA